PAERKQINKSPALTTTTLATDASCVPPAPCNVISSTVSNPLLNSDAAQAYVMLDNTDLNARGQTHMTLVQTRLSGKITAPDAFGAKVTGLIEGDFFGPTEATIYAFGLRHAWINLDWGKTSLRVGQDWRPLFLQAGVFPGTVQFNPIAPIHPFGRAPQITLRQKMGDFTLGLYVMGQSGHSDTGPDGQTTKAIRNAQVPELAAQLVYAAGPITLGGTIDHSVLRPVDSTNPSYQNEIDSTSIGNNDAEVGATTYQLFGQLKTGEFVLKLSTTLGENLFNAAGLGGYAVKKDFILDNLSTTNSPLTENEITAMKAFKKRDYLPIRTHGYWAEIAYGKDIEVGIVGGRVHNLGAADYINTSLIYGRGSNIKTVTTIAPRIKFTSGRTILALEYIYSEAAYMEDDKNLQKILTDLQTSHGATDPNYLTLQVNGMNFNNGLIRDDKGKVGETYTAINHRIQLSVIQNF
ncbi:MAG: hypothetical protein H3C43_11825, partial [Leptonema sp. (in: Bacteria)]|nr:hypothetical protein [Leptonema sp. (in: bacteria)]